MKKLIILLCMGTVLSTISTFGQGWFTFQSSPRYVWDDGSYNSNGFPSPAFDSNFDAAFLWAPSIVTSASVDSIFATGTPTNNSLADFQPYDYATAWSDILNDPNFTLAGTNNGTSTTDWVAPGVANGSFQANGGFEFGVTGTTSLTTYNLYVIAWEEVGGVLYSTPQQAAANYAPVGWSDVFTYQAQAAPPLGAYPAAMGLNKFGIAYPDPEPTTLTLAGLGGLSMLFLRRKKA